MTKKEMNNCFDGGFFIDIEEFNKIETRIKFRKLYKCQEIVEKFPNIIARQPQNYKHRFFISHRWDNSKNPDIRNWQIEALRQFSSEMIAKETIPACFWYDYCSLPQAPRNKQDTHYFNKGLKKINYLCRTCTVIALISTTNPDGNICIRNMLKRGWILVELFIAEHHNKVYFALFEGSQGDYITFTKVNRLLWRDTIPDLLALLPFYDKFHIRKWFDFNKIKCTNGADLDLVAGYLNQHIYAYVKNKIKIKPAKLKNGITYQMTATEISEYFINKYGFSILFPNTYFKTENCGYDCYLITSFQRPKLPLLDTWTAITQKQLDKFKINNDLSPMYPGIKFKSKTQKKLLLVKPSMIKIDWKIT